MPHMAEDLTPSQVRARRFEVTRRGYDRAEVESYLGAIADEVDHIRDRLATREAKELAVGLDDPEAFALEFGTIAEDIGTILEAARAAAEGMRTRASHDADDWRSTTEGETRKLLVEATEQSQSMRASAWNEGSSMLSSASAAASSEVLAAREDALFIRAESEREAIRLTGDAKRDREESIRTARTDAEQMLESARTESDGILAAANQQAEQAQERARALEDRRAELLAELESTRSSIGKLEEEIESRRQKLETPEPELVPESDPRAHHSSDGGSVRIVASTRSVRPKPVDAEELVADVVALRSTVAPQIAPEAIPAVTETVAVIAPPLAEEPAASSSRTVETEESATETPPAPAESVDDIGSLFASLKAESASPLQGGQASSQARGGREPASLEELEASNQGGPEGPDVLETTDVSTLIPLQNAALKEIKRTLVDLQSDALEYLRIDSAWTPRKTFTNRFGAPYAQLALGITGSKDDGGAAKMFSSNLHGAVAGAISKARDSGAGDRQTASDVSRVFRMWRADEAERRVADTARSLADTRHQTPDTR